MTRDPRRLLIAGAAATFALSSLFGAWVSTARHLGGQGSLTIHGTARPWDGYFWPWFGIALFSMTVAAAVAVYIQLRDSATLARFERATHAAAGLAGGAAMAAALWLGPGGSFSGDDGLFITRSGPLAFAGMLLAAAPLVIALLLRPARPALALAAALSLIVATTALALHQTTFRPQPPSGPIPDWRTNPAEPYPFTGPVPPLVETAIEGTFDRPPTDTYAGPPRARCTRCPPFPRDAGRSTLTFDRGRYYLSQEERPYKTFGHYEITRGHVTIFNDPECGDVRGVYRWQLDGSQLTLTTLFDPCAFGQRARDMTESAWTLAAPEK